jgi:GH43 family beta-xylosidase
MKLALTAFLATLSICVCAWPQAVSTYTNPVGDPPIRMGDPFVLQHAGKYYLFGTTSSNTGFQYYTSEDLVYWKPGGWAYQKTENSWADALFWAPEVKFYRGKFYMTYSGRVRGSNPALWKMLTALAVSDKPEGPYRDLHAPWFDAGYSAIDGHIFVDTDGAPYLYFSRNGSQDGYSYGVNYGVALAGDLSKLLGEPVKLTEADQPWERINWARNRCNEGPAVLKHNGKYYLTYSANSTGAPGYGVGYAVADKPLGPWVKSPDNPLLASSLEIGVSSPGHNSITMSPDGKEMFIVYHSHADPDNPKGARVVNIDRLVFDKSGRLRVIGPTRSPQPMPSGIQHKPLTKGAY